MIAAKYSGPAAYPKAPVFALICSQALRKSSQVQVAAGSGTPAFANNSFEYHMHIVLNSPGR